MATTKSTRKAPAKASRKTSAAKTTTKTTKKTVKKPVTKAKVEVNKPVATVLSPLDRLRSMHIGLALMYTVFAAVVIGFVDAASTSVNLGIQAKDEFASTGSTILSNASEHLYNIQPQVLLVLSLAVSALGSLLLATKLRARYEATVAARISGLRWILMGVSAALLITFVNMMAGVTDFATLKLSGALIIFTTMFAWLADRDNAVSGDRKWLAFNLSLLSGALAWLPVVGSLIGTSLFASERFGWHVYALAGVVLAGFTGFALNQLAQIRAKNGIRDYVSVEQTYMRIDMLTKFAVVLIVLLALQNA